MAVLWDAGAWLTHREAGERLTGQPPTAYSAVMIILRRLWRKWALRRRRQGKAFAYYAVHDRDTGDRLVALLYAGRDSELALRHFLDGLDAPRRGDLGSLMDGARS